MYYGIQKLLIFVKQKGIISFEKLKIMQLTFSTFNDLKAAVIDSPISEKFTKMNIWGDEKISYSSIKEFCYSELDPVAEISNTEIGTFMDGIAKIFKLSENVYWVIADTESDEDAYFDRIDDAQKWATDTLFTLTNYTDDETEEEENA